MSRILVTGSNGLIGSNLTKELVKRGHDVSGLDIVTGCDLNNADEVNDAFKKINPQYVYHLAANAAEAWGQVSPKDMTDNNIGIFANVLKASINQKVKKFLYTSSVAVYGDAPVPYEEDGPTNPKDVYGINKLACEQMLKVMAKVYGIEYTIFRPHNIYGPGQNMADPYRNVVALFMRKLREGEPYKLFGEGEMRRGFSYIDDVVDVLAESLDERFNGQIFNLGSDNDISIKDLSDLLQEITGLSSEIEMLPARPQEINLFLADHTKQNELVMYNETPIREGLEKTWGWVLTQELPEVIKKENEINVHKG